MSQFTLLRGARQVLTLHGPGGARRGSALKQISSIQDGSVLICDGLIKSVGSTRRVENLKEARAALEVDVHGCVLMPGFIDSGLQTSSERFGVDRRRPKKSREIFDENLDLMRSCLQHGTLTVEMKVDEPGRFPAAVPVLRQLEKIGDNPVRMIRTWKISRLPEFTDELEELLATLEVLRRRKLTNFVEICASVLPSPFGPEIVSALSASNLPVKLDGRKGLEQTPDGALKQLKPVDISCSTWISEAEAKRVAQSVKVATFSPGTEIAESCGPGMRHVIDYGGAVALTSGYDCRSAPGHSMQNAIARAVHLGKLSVEEAISAATVNSAYALGKGEDSGTIEAGRRADIVVLAIPDYRELPRQFGINQVSMAVRAGHIVFNRGRWKMGAHAQDGADGGMRPEYLRRTRSQAS